ncbi:Mov34/MPN/PAD-1 family protein [Idiomarina sp. HP20-50]|uniref:Mov34/MPN/PAD-1 family protein n=1 Tax=Idiomarina sp. HP20-50 TaxID=3070813 RepID=UPI00294AA9D8|nr:Mov34/MPN/PAD-1 family protein [Idiomarina sp. HP20-50]MDV6315731.1 Mov34/MPN/PAD-1 family protein [Idiomarina sp. HP20-50]
MTIKFLDSDTGFSVEFTDEVADIFCDFHQCNSRNENGGMLFCNVIDKSEIRITFISTTTNKDVTSKNFFQHDKLESQKLIDRLFKRGLHYVGDWHSHFESEPEPSVKDIKTIKSVFNQSRHDLRFMLHVIMGADDDFKKAFVCITDGILVRKLNHDC